MRGFIFPLKECRAAGGPVQLPLTLLIHSEALCAEHCLHTTGKCPYQMLPARLMLAGKSNPR